MKNMKRALRILLAIGLIAAVVGGYWIIRNRTASAASTASSAVYSQTVQVKQGNISSNISVVGQLEAVQSASLSFERMSGTANLATLSVQAGSVVTAGQTLATIDPAPYQQALDQAKSDLQAAEETLADLKTPATALETAQADVAVAKAQAVLAKARADLVDLNSPDMVKLHNAVKDAQDNLALLQLQADLAEHDSLAKSERDLQYSTGWYGRRVTQLEQLVAEGKANLEQTQELAKARTSFASLQADLARVQAERRLAAQARAAQLAKAKVVLANAQEALATALAGGDPLTLAQQQVAINEAQVSLQAAQKARADLLAGADATKIAAAQAAVDKKRLAFSDAQAALDCATLVAPFDGTVLKTNVAAGDQVSSLTTVLTIANLKQMQVVAAIDETTIQQVSAGQSATITFDAFPGQTFTGAVQSVPLQGALQGGVMVYAVPLSLHGADKVSLLVGMTANVKIAVGQAQNVLLAPTVALQKANGLYQALIPNTSDPNGEPVAAPVEVGLSDGTYTQIVKGLNAGDQVVYQAAATTTGSNFGGSATSSFLRMLGGR
jgi:HlyD family secretion protein